MQDGNIVMASQVMELDMDKMDEDADGEAKERLALCSVGQKPKENN